MKSSTLIVWLFTLSTLLLGGCFNTTPPTKDTDTTPWQLQHTDSTETDNTLLESWVIITKENTSNSITLADIASHSKESDCRTAIEGTVYDVTAFFGTHPGGDQNLFRVCGIDATPVFKKQHGNAGKPNNVLAGFEIGILKL